MIACLLQQELLSCSGKENVRKDFGEFVTKIDSSTSFRDRKSCNDCKSFFYRHCGHETFLLSTSCPLFHVNIEKVLNSLPNIAGERCDALFYNENKVVLLDMYCGLTQYVESHLLDGKMMQGKRAKVRSQIDSTIKLLAVHPAIAEYFAQLQDRHGVFGYRQKDEGMFVAVPSLVERATDKFLGLSGNLRSRRIFTPLSNGFKFINVKYPQAYEW